MAKARIHVSGGAFEGAVVSALKASRALTCTPVRHFGFDAVESEGRICLFMRDRGATCTVTPNGMVDASSTARDVMDLTPAQEPQLPAGTMTRRADRGLGWTEKGCVHMAAVAADKD